MSLLKIRMAILHYIWHVYANHLNIVQVLLAQPFINVNSKDKDGLMPLHLATNDGHVEAVELLLNTIGIDINARDKDDNTPLHLIDFLYNSTSAGNFHVDPVLKSSRTFSTLQFCAPCLLEIPYHKRVMKEV